jgi:gluconolactonase
MHPSLRVDKEDVLQFIQTDFVIETLADNCRFTEGPVWNEEGFYLFSDITDNVVNRIVPGQTKELYIANSGTDKENDHDLKPGQTGSNGLAYDKNADLLVCRHGSHMIALWKGNSLMPLITAYHDKPFNSPNDLVVDEKGRIYFSDPPYGLKDGKLNPEKFQPLAGVYCYDNEESLLICDKYQYPNGVCITPDGEELYICSNKPFEKFISVYDLETFRFKRILAEENSDGIKCDIHGNVYLCHKDGIIILNSEGKRLALINLSAIPANCCWGGPKKKDLFVTARENIFLIRNLLR